MAVGEKHRLYNKKICLIPKNSYLARANQENSCRPRENLQVSRLTWQSIVYYNESRSTTSYSAERCVMRHDHNARDVSGGRYEDLFPAHVTSLNQSYFFICHINYMRRNKIYCFCLRTATSPASGGPEPCGMALQDCYSIIGLWAVGFNGECFHQDAGFPVGKSAGFFKKVVMQVCNAYFFF